MKRILSLALATALAGCASSPDKLATASVSPMTYRNYDCEQVAEELDRVNRRANELHTSLKKKADDDTAQMTIGMILFWPALFFLEGGDGPEAAEYSRLKGEREALEKVAVQKRCSLPPAPQPATVSAPPQTSVTDGTLQMPASQQ